MNKYLVKLAEMASQAPNKEPDQGPSTISTIAKMGLVGLPSHFAGAAVGAHLGKALLPEKIHVPGLSQAAKDVAIPFAKGKTLGEFTHTSGSALGQFAGMTAAGLGADYMVLRHDKKKAQEAAAQQQESTS